jgi:hypothetical protein
MKSSSLVMFKSHGNSRRNRVIIDPKRLTPLWSTLVLVAVLSMTFFSFLAESGLLVFHLAALASLLVVSTLLVLPFT